MVVMQKVINSQSNMTAMDTTSERTFTQALRDKYVNQEEIEDKLILPKDKTISTEIMFVGFGKVRSIQKQLKQLISIDLSSRHIKFAGSFEDFENCLNRVAMLNLANNHLSWSEVISILSHLPNLKELILTRNHLGCDSCILQSPCNKKLTSLTLGRVYLDWSTIIRTISNIWSRIEQLDLWDNDLTGEKMGLNFEDYTFIRHLHVLKLSNNCFTDISWINCIGPVENLKELDLSRCQIQCINITASIANQLRHLSHLNISYNNIDSWDNISNLFVLDNLINLICFENPIYISETNAKFLTIGRLGKLQKLNREEITNGQRRDSEIFYLRKTFPEFESSQNGQTEEFKLLHPRYTELIEIYGIPEDLKKKQVVDKYIDLKLCLGDKMITKKLPCDMRVANVKMLCKRLFKLRLSGNLDLTYCEASTPENKIEYKLDKDGQTLHFFSVRSGHKLIINELD